MSTHQPKLNNVDLDPLVDARPFRTGKHVSRKRVMRYFERVAGSANCPELVDAKAARTWQALNTRWGRWERWCRRNGRPTLPASPEQLRDYARDLFRASVKGSSLGVYLSAISTISKLRGHPVDLRLTSEFAKAARRRSGPPRQAAPLRGRDLAEIVALLDLDHTRDLRDGVCLLLAFAVAGRASELVGLDWLYSSGSRLGGTGFLTIERSGLRVRWNNTKTAQAEETTLGIPDSDLPQLRPLLMRWLTIAGVQPGEPVLQPVHKSGRIIKGRLGPEQVTRIVQRHAEALALARGATTTDAKAFARRHSSHSVRRGFCTTAAEAGLSLGTIKARSRHASDAELARYVAAAERERCSGLAGLIPAKIP